ncbi:MAG: hypothetical protein K0S09_1414 [Sphingobacteriaceae bacterium]|jgi:hypothetical protein|nr:hypothetical protein [Sphingobacteriaceae bacterium]
MARNYKIFVSHSWAYNQDLRNLQNLLENRGYFKVEFQESTPNNPIDSENSAYIKRRLKEKIDASDIVLGIAGIYASYSDWIAWELATAQILSVPVIGVIPRGQERISSVVNKYSLINVRWNTESIVDAIRAYAKGSKAWYQ